jgi:hypothetical protein
MRDDRVVMVELRWGAQELGGQGGWTKSFLFGVKLCIWPGSGFNSFYSAIMISPRQKIKH